jgi:hypothetical protein
MIVCACRSGLMGSIALSIDYSGSIVWGTAIRCIGGCSDDGIPIIRLAKQIGSGGSTEVLSGVLFRAAVREVLWLV